VSSHLQSSRIIKTECGSKTKKAHQEEGNNAMTKSSWMTKTRSRKSHLLSFKITKNIVNTKKVTYLWSFTRLRSSSSVADVTDTVLFLKTFCVSTSMSGFDKVEGLAFRDLDGREVAPRAGLDPSSEVRSS